MLIPVSSEAKDLVNATYHRHIQDKQHQQRKFKLFIKIKILISTEMFLNEFGRMRYTFFHASPQQNPNPPSNSILNPKSASRDTVVGKQSNHPQNLHTPTIVNENISFVSGYHARLPGYTNNLVQEQWWLDVTEDCYHSV